MELGWMAGTTQTCLEDLSQSSLDINTAFGVREKQIVPGSACAFSADPNLALCPR